MSEQLNINTFHELLNSESDQGLLLGTLRSITEVNDPADLNLKAGSTALGTWAGWRR